MGISKEKGNYEIYSISGNLLERGTYYAPKNIATGLQSGIYLIRFVSETGKTDSGKFVISR